MKFEVEYNEALGRWTARTADGRVLTAPVRGDDLLAWLTQQVRGGKEVTSAERPDWYKPMAHVGKRHRSAEVADATNLYEIRGGRVQRIASSAAERASQQLLELSSLLELDGGDND